MYQNYSSLSKESLKFRLTKRFLRLFLFAKIVLQQFSAFYEVRYINKRELQTQLTNDMGVGV